MRLAAWRSIWGIPNRPGEFLFLDQRTLEFKKKRNLSPCREDEKASPGLFFFFFLVNHLRQRRFETLSIIHHRAWSQRWADLLLVEPSWLAAV